MESLTEFEPLLRAPLGGKPSAWRDAGSEALYISRVWPRHVGASTTRHITLADYLVQFCASTGCRLYPPRYAGLGNRCARWRRRVLRHWSANRVTWVHPDWIYDADGWPRIVSSASGRCSRHR